MAGDKARQAADVLLDAIIATAGTYEGGVPDERGVRILYALAEAHAWLVAPAASHGGGSSPRD